ncbi:hypothetical protein PWH01_003130 [Salmonella enterica]|nr:hypothetical protein [Salmonella enterica]
MQKFLSLLFSRRALAVVGVLVLALLVWFVGPLVSFIPCARWPPWVAG